MASCMALTMWTISMWTLLWRMFATKAMRYQTSRRQGERVYPGDDGQELHQPANVGGAMNVYNINITLSYLAVDCRNPVTSVNGGFRGKTTYKSIVNFFCHDGYYAGVAKSALCQADKQWSARGPSCTRKFATVKQPTERLCYYETPIAFSIATIIYLDLSLFLAAYCTKPPNPIHGQVTLHWSVLVQKRIATNTEITYTCDKSYIWVGAANVRRCIGPLTWSGKAPTCQSKAIRGN